MDASSNEASGERAIADCWHGFEGGRWAQAIDAEDARADAFSDSLDGARLGGAVAAFRKRRRSAAFCAQLTVAA